MPYTKHQIETPKTLMSSGFNSSWSLKMITLTDDEVALVRSILTSLRAIKVRDIDKALVILSKTNHSENY